MIDQYQRTIDYLRLSVTDRCNMNCCYCRPEGECFRGQEGSRLLSLEELYQLCEIFSELGITKIKVTGGEPFLRTGILSLLRRLKKLPGVSSVTLTTNGRMLWDTAEKLAKMGMDGINVSLDSFQPDVFSSITGITNGKAVLDGILRGMDRALELGLPLKVNTVLMRGKNDGEIASFVQLARERPVSVRFIEMMPIGEGKRFETISGEEILTRLHAMEGGLRPCEKQLGNGPAVYYDAEGWKGQIGLIRAVTAPFCSSCNRIRVTADGKLRLCLAYEDGVDLAVMLREKWSREAMKQAICQAVFAKPAAHPLDGWKKEMSRQDGKDMWQIGG